MARLLLILCLLTSPALAKVRCISLVQAKDLEVEVGKWSAPLPPERVVGPWQNPTAIARVTLRQTGRRLLSQRLGLTDEEQTLVFFGVPSARPQPGLWEQLKARFEGQEYHSKQGFSLQLRVLREEIFSQKSQAYLRVLHAVPTLVGVDLLEGDEQLVSSLEYAHCSEILTLPAGHHQLNLRPHRSRLELKQFEVDLEPGRLTTILLGGHPESPHPVILTSKGS